MSSNFHPSEKGSCIKGFLIGCSLLVLLIGMIMLGTFVYLKKHGPEFYSDLMTTVIDHSLNQSGLSEEEQTAIKEQFSRVTAKLKTGEITNQDLVRITDVFGQGSLFYLFPLEMAEHEWIPSSKLLIEEKDRGIRVLQRTKRGLIEGKFDTDQMIFIHKALPFETDDFGNEQLDPHPTTDQVSDLIGELHIVNDQAGIPEGEYRVDYVNYVRGLVDEILGEETAPSGPPPATDQVQSASAEIQAPSPSVD